jgi:hypothetical protein
MEENPFKVLNDILIETARDGGATVASIRNAVGLRSKKLEYYMFVLETIEMVGQTGDRYLTTKSGLEYMNVFQGNRAEAQKQRLDL